MAIGSRLETEHVDEVEDSRLEGGSLVLGTAQTATPLKSRYQNLANPFCLEQ
jgi:hypothetical protein